MSKYTLWLFAGVLLAASTTSLAEPTSSASNSPPSVAFLLNKMSQEAARTQYRGSFTYQNQTSINLQSFTIEHWVANGVEHDRLVFLNGPEREILREGQPVDCKPMGDKLLQGHFSQMGQSLAKLDELYQFEIRGQERVAGRLARVLQVIPKDPYRYGYLLSIDEETGLVLRSWMIDENARPLERYQFVSIELNPDLTDAKKQKVFARAHHAMAMVTPCNPMELGTPIGWRVAWLPPGFAFAGQRKLENGQDMLMYTDGLTTFSIFLEPAPALIPEGIGQRGATLAYMTRLMHNNIAYRISVVGEIPAAAATKIAQNIVGQ